MLDLIPLVMAIATLVAAMLLHTQGKDWHFAAFLCLINVIILVSMRVG